LSTFLINFLSTFAKNPKLCHNYDFFLSFFVEGMTHVFPFLLRLLTTASAMCC